MLEKTVEKHLCDCVKATGGEHRKLVFAGYRGAPDRLVGWPKRWINIWRADSGKPSSSADTYEKCSVHVLVELKKPKGPGAEAHQQREHKRLRAIGFDVRVIHTKEQVDAFILEMTT